MKLSIWPSTQRPWPELLGVARHADAGGWDGLWVADHFMGDGGGFGAEDVPQLEATAVLAGLATVTERLRLGPLVLGATYRHPAVVANWAITVDHTSGGRFVLGLGAGWQQNEHEQYGIRLGPPAERLARLEEACVVIRSLFDEDRTDHDGEHYTLRGARCEPPAVQERLPLLVGGKGDRLLGLVARRADEWNMWGLPATIAERVAVLDRRCEEQGRDPATIARSTQALVLVTDDAAEARRFVERVAPRAAVAGPPDHFAEVVARWGELGVGEVVVPDWHLGRGAELTDHMDALAEAVAPLRGAGS